MKKAKEYEVIRTIEEKFYIEASNKEEAIALVKHAECAIANIKSFKAKVLPPLPR